MFSVAGGAVGGGDGAEAHGEAVVAFHIGFDGKLG